jgi:hypothetical protein
MSLDNLKEYSFFPRYSSWLFVISLIIISFIYGYHNIYFLPPQSIHQWRQCDCLSLTLNYYQDGKSFLDPGVHNLGDDGTGRTVSEFPLVYYTIAQLWKVVGYQEFIYRIVVLLIFWVGLLTLFRAFEEMLQDSVIAIMAVLLLFTSPTLVYYANSFLSDIPALSFALIGLGYFLRFLQTSRDKNLYKVAFFYSLAGLLKISALLGFIAICCVFLLEILKKDREQVVFLKPFRHGFSLLGVFVCVSIWYVWAYNYNLQYNSGNFLLGTLPIWGMNNEEIDNTLDGIHYHILWDYFRRETQALWILLYIFIIFSFNRAHQVLRNYTIIASLGFMVFVVLFFSALKDHDYYTTNLFILVPIILITFFDLLRKHYNRIFGSLILKILLLAFLIHNVDFARRRITGRYDTNSWQNDYYSAGTNSYREIGPYLDSIGVTQDTKVLCLSDNTINVSLYLMNRKGWTNYGIYGDSMKIASKIVQGAEYLFIMDQATFNQYRLESFVNERIGSFNSIDIYRLRLSDQ